MKWKWNSLSGDCTVKCCDVSVSCFWGAVGRPEIPVMLSRGGRVSIGEKAQIITPKRQNKSDYNMTNRISQSGKREWHPNYFLGLLPEHKMLIWMNWQLFGLPKTPNLIITGLLFWNFLLGTVNAMHHKLILLVLVRPTFLPVPMTVL